MAAMIPELSRPIRLDTLGGAPRPIAVTAEEGERAALARRFGLVAVDRLDAAVDLTREGDVVIATGRLAAAVVQSCVATAEPVPATIDAPFALRFVPAATADADDELELDETDLDEIAYEGGAIDAGEAVAQTLALALDPFPRSPRADTALRDAGVIGEDEVRPHSALSGLKDLLAGR